MQVCGHEDTLGLNELYRICEAIREVTMKPEWRVVKVIVRPYVGDNVDNYVIISNRRDYAIEPPNDTALNIYKIIIMILSV